MHLCTSKGDKQSFGLDPVRIVASTVESQGLDNKGNETEIANEHKTDRIQKGHNIECNNALWGWNEKKKQLDANLCKVVQEMFSHCNQEMKKRLRKMADFETPA